MKLNALLTLAIFLLAQPSSAFGMNYLQYALTEINWRFRSQPPIPQFILDTRHPWLSDRDGKTLLYSFDDPTDALCNLSSPLRPVDSDVSPLKIPWHNGKPCKVDRPAGYYANLSTYPADLYSNLKIGNNGLGGSRPGWKNARARLQEMLACPAALKDVRSFTVDIWISDGKYGIGYAEPSTPASDIPALFVEVLSQMPNLTRLEWNTYGNGIEEFRSAFTAANLTLPHVRYLRPAIFYDWLVDICPGVERLESGHSDSTANYWRWTSHKVDGRGMFVNSTQRLANLTSFSMEGEWDLKYAEALVKTAPNLTDLSISGELVQSWSDRDPSILRGYAKVISRFAKLERLRLPYSSSLGLGFDGGHWCGNAYDGPGGRAYGRSVARQTAEATEEAAQIVLEQLPSIRELSIGGSTANITRHENGTASATWSWTGRMKEWTYEVWPAEEPGEEKYDADYLSLDLEESVEGSIDKGNGTLA